MLAVAEESIMLYIEITRAVSRAQYFVWNVVYRKLNCLAQLSHKCSFLCRYSLRTQFDRWDISFPNMAARVSLTWIFWVFDLTFEHEHWKCCDFCNSIQKKMWIIWFDHFYREIYKLPRIFNSCLYQLVFRSLAGEPGPNLLTPTHKRTKIYQHQHIDFALYCAAHTFVYVSCKLIAKENHKNASDNDKSHRIKLKLSLFELLIQLNCAE